MPDRTGDSAGALSLGPFADNLGLRLTATSADEVTGVWEAGAHLHQPFGVVNGGAHCTVVETLASVGAGAWFGDRGTVVGVSNQTDFYRAVTVGTMRSRAVPIHRGRSQQVWVVETHDADDRLVARGQVRLQNLARPAG
jgi:1,4-dihydroxy-2-naphthoyl-CoA hydrolase